MGRSFEDGIHDLSYDPFSADEVAGIGIVRQLFPGTDIRRWHKDNAESMKHPEAVIRKDAHDPGTVLEIKTVTGSGAGTIKKNLEKAAKQVQARGGGQVYIDARSAQVTEESAVQGWRRYVGLVRKNNAPMPRLTVIALPGGKLLRFEGEQSV